MRCVIQPHPHSIQIHNANINIIINACGIRDNAFNSINSLNSRRIWQRNGNLYTTDCIRKVHNWLKCHDKVKAPGQNPLFFLEYGCGRTKLVTHSL